jgi:hypothetical protein
MKDRWLTLLLAIGAFAAFFRFFIGSVNPVGEEFSRPLSAESRANGYLAMREWLAAQGIPVDELRHRYGWLADAPGIPERGNILVTTIPLKRAARDSEVEALHEWIGRGNSLLVAAGIFDTPEWGMPDSGTQHALYQLTALQFRAFKTTDSAPADGPEAPTPFPAMRLAEPKGGSMHPVGDHPYTAGIGTVVAQSEYPAGVFEVISGWREPVLVLMADDESGSGALWLTWHEEGTILVSAYGSVFTNKMIAQADNAKLLANSVGHLLGPGGHVIFDDLHQGASSLYDEEAFFGDPRLHASFWWIIGLWLLWVLGGTRLPPPASPPQPMRERSFLTAAGNLLARKVDRRRAAERMFANFFNDQRRAIGEPVNGEPLWEWLRAFGAVPRSDVDALARMHADLAAGRRVDLVELHNRLHQLRKQLA